MADTSTADTLPVSYQVVDRVAHVTIERPTSRNAMDLAVFDALHARADEVAADPHVGAVVVSGRGGVFSAGIDLALVAGLAEDPVEPGTVARLQAAFTAYEDLAVPTIAAVEGHCLGAGFQLALACHLRAAAPSARFALLEARWGLVPDLGATWRLPRLIGSGRATALMLTARTVPADEAYGIGIVEHLLPADGALDAAHEFAAELAHGPAALREIPRLVRENHGRDRAGALQAEAQAQQRVTSGTDVREAVTAHRESRAPRWAGR